MDAPVRCVCKTHRAGDDAFSGHQLPLTSILRVQKVLEVARWAWAGDLPGMRAQLFYDGIYFWQQPSPWLSDAPTHERGAAF